MKKKKRERNYRKNDMRDEEWAKIKDYIKEREERRTGKNGGSFLNGIFWILKT